MDNDLTAGAFSIQNLGASGLRPDRAFRGSAIAPAPALRTVAASRPSNPLRAAAADVRTLSRKELLS
jgi:hypothetical protein